MKKHYDEDYIHAVQASLLSLKEESYAKLPLASSRIIDIGCGAGTDVLRMAQQLPQHQYTGVDHDHEFIQSAKKALNDADVNNVVFQTGDITQLTFESQSFEAVRLDRILQHISPLEKALKEVKRILNKNGDVVIIETDWSSMRIYHENFHFFDDLTSYYADTKIPQGRVIYKLPSILENLGFSDINVKIDPFVIEGEQLLNTFFYLDKGIEEVAELKGIKDISALKASVKDSDQKGRLKASINMALIHATLR